MVVRVLCLPGYGQNAITFRRKFAAIQKQCEGVDFVIVDPPHILLHAFDLSDTPSEPRPPPKPINADTPAELIPRSWWMSNADRTIYHNLDPSLAYIKTLLEEQEVPFDGVLGFSQGGALAALLVAMLERPDALPKVKINHIPMKFGIFMAGFKTLDLTVTHIFDELVTTPTVHIVGKTDFIVGKKRSQPLIDACQNPRVEWHEGEATISHEMPRGEHSSERTWLLGIPRAQYPPAK